MKAVNLYDKRNANIGLKFSLPFLVPRVNAPGHLGFTVTWRPHNSYGKFIYNIVL
jgi:hypothetical protein